MPIYPTVTTGNKSQNSSYSLLYNQTEAQMTTIDLVGF
ncbi:hypothetical protein VCHC19A1_3429 [Vibrio cholerae HC-19A1]|nr:hypothetical protein VCH_003140 [Vibrio cholerae CIRS101]EGS55391.1 hypothetical protein VCHC40A1_3254 [Vibrio cholerae HC-40A1]EGS57972.1 hypothetical protein VCHFU02_3264 [Vibrio cholerae HFU-02]EHH72205.1 hypothetical protein VCHC19A1_3429 [Vibrio cholerae HC-19A1]EHH79221.1 hypothetical protein VCHC21A1_2935 [Vibrio cholerae HC-21A1]EHH91142.1 hypothetical protein VCHC22A1_2968 [Vibrio cholerae HC-22A1]EHH93299.1 hypothetical protein VCHC28A1_3428 [Vibrio cholerae HC-28A1]EHI02939.1 h